MAVELREQIAIRLPSPLAEVVIITAAEQEVSVEEVLEAAIKNYLKGRLNNGR